MSYNHFVRLGRYVLAELLIVGVTVAGGTLVSRRALRAASTALASAARQSWRDARTFPPRGEISNPPPLAIVDDPAGTFMGMSDDLLLARVRAQTVVRVKVNKGGSTLSFRLDFADGSRAAFKPAQTNLQTIPRKEVAAYRLNRLLGLNAVPPAAPRTITRDELVSHLHPDSLAALPRIRAETIFDPAGRTNGVAMYWIPEIKESGLDSKQGLADSGLWLSQGGPIPAHKEAMAAQVSDLVVFDFVASNPDRYTGGNMKMSPDGQRLYFMDNTMSFFLDTEGNDQTRPVLRRTQRFSRRLYDALGRISVPALEQALSEGRHSPFEILTPSEIRAVVARRDAVRRHVETLALAYGENNVLVFP